MSKNKAARKNVQLVPQPEQTDRRNNISKQVSPEKKGEVKRERKLRIVPLDEEDRGAEFIDGALSNRVTPDE
jgi:hypothetical protein